MASQVVTSEGVGYELLKQLEDATSRGVRVTLVLPARTKGDLGEADATRRIRELADRRRRLEVLEGQDVDSLMAWDERCVLGGFPWLGHTGNPERSLINHESVAVYDESATEEALADSERRFGVKYRTE